MMASVLETLYISFDLETLGGNPDDETVINWGFVAYTEKERKKVGSLSVNTFPKKPDTKTVEWFNSTPNLKAAYEKCTTNAVTPLELTMQKSFLISWTLNKTSLLTREKACAHARVAHALFFFVVVLMERQGHIRNAIPVTKD